MDRKNNFDFMRFIAATLVVYSHSFPLLHAYGREPFGRASGYFTGGELGVAIFFVMSGFLVTASLQNSPNTVQFLMKRALRIFPALAVVVLLAVFVLGPLLTTLPLSTYFHHGATRQYLWNMLLWIHYPLPGVFEDLPHAGSVNGSLWTLPIEVAMYVGLAALGIVGLVKRRWIPALVLLLVGLYAWLQFHPALQQTMVWKIGVLKECAKFAVFFFSGSALYLLERLVPWRVSIALLLVTVWIAGFRKPFGIYCMFLAVPYCTLYIARARYPLLANFGKYGDFSYGIYIYAFPVQQTLVQVLGRDQAPEHLFVAAWAISLACAALSWHFIEKPALGLKGRIALPARAAGAAAAGDT
jgi:peptidoglycan/LPS O-acetylase OafA/YrhL